MDNAQYDRTIVTTWLGSGDDREDMLHAVFGLLEEAGEIAGKFKRIQRGDYELNPHELLKELGDLQYYTSTIARLLGYDTIDIMAANAQKILARPRRGVLKGAGDDR